MSRRRVDPKRLARVAVLAAVLLAPAPSGAQSVSSPQVTGVEMTPRVRNTLKQIEEQWLQWIVQNNREQAKGAVDNLLETARQIGMTRLPDLSAGAVARAVQAAREKDFPRAHWSLEAAERFDPGRPETAFAEAGVLRLEGQYPGAVLAWLSALPRIFGHPLERYLLLQDLVIWILTLLLVTGGLFVAVQMLTKGTSLFQDMVDFLGRSLPRPAAFILAALALLWPLALPYGSLWLLLYWSLLLWGYGSTSERVVLIVLWLLAGASPILVGELRQRMTVELSPPARAMRSLEERRLYGALFSDLGALRSLLPDSVAVKHLLADVHRSLNQWDLARSLYRQVLEKEPENTAALMNLGAYFYLKGDFGQAIQHFQKVATVDPANAAAQYNLSQAYSESYLFDEQKRALTQARELDYAKVSHWVSNSQQRVVTVNGGMARIPEIRRELLDTWRRQEGKDERLALFRRGLPLLVSALLILVAVALHFARRTERPETAREARSLGRWGRALLPGFRSAEEGEGLRSYAALLLPLGLLMLPFFQGVGYRIPWGYDPGNVASWIVASAGLVLWFGARLRLERQNEV